MREITSQIVWTFLANPHKTEALCQHIKALRLVGHVEVHDGGSGYGVVVTTMQDLRCETECTSRYNCRQWGIIHMMSAVVRSDGADADN